MDIYRFLLQVFAGAVALIYNSIAINSLILSRNVVNSIFLGHIDSWYKLNVQTCKWCVFIKMVHGLYFDWS